MITKKIFLLSLIIITNYSYCNPLAAQFALNRKQCTGKMAKQREPLFIQAEANEDYFFKTKEKCLEIGNCDSDEDYAQAKNAIILSLEALENHLKTLEEKNDGACHVCEKNETKDIKRRLTELLNA